MRAEAGVDGGDLFRFGIVELNLPPALVQWNDFCGWMGRAVTAEWLGLILADPRRDPHPAFLIHGEAVGIRLAGPDRFLVPVRRRLRGLGVSFTGRPGIADRQFDLTRGVAHRINNRHIIRSGLERSVNEAIRVDRGIPLVARDFIVEIGFRVGPIPHRDHNVSFFPLRPRRLNRRQLTGCNSICPLGVHLQGTLPANLGELNSFRRPPDFD